MREETIMASVVKHTADLMQENHKLKADLAQAHEMIREMREALEFYGNCFSLGITKFRDDDPTRTKPHQADNGYVARAVLQKWQGKLG